MLKGANLKPKLQRIAVFGAGGKVGKAVARHIKAHGPDRDLRLIIRSERRREKLAAEFPDAEIVVADYYDLASLEKALRGTQGVFVVTPDFIDEERAMTNLVYAVRTTGGSVRQLVRLLGDPPGMSLDRVPDVMREFGGGTAVQHMRAKKVLEPSGLPFTYINVGAYFMQNFSGPGFQVPLQKHRLLITPRNRRMGFIDTNDIGRCAGALLLSDNHRHIGQTYHLDNGNDVLWFHEVADLMTEVWGEKITYDGSDEAFIEHLQDVYAKVFGRADAVHYFIGFSQFEQDNETIWRKSDVVEYLTGEKAKTLATWLSENKQRILG